jgi:hypothetical protein
MQGAKDEGDCIDMLLDLGAGSMSVFKNGEPLGVMQESGLGGAGVEYRWAVVLLHPGNSARIDAVPAAEVGALVQARDAQEAQREQERQAQEAQWQQKRKERVAKQQREREAQQERERELDGRAQRERENLARIAREQDLALPAGTRLRVHGHASDGVYVRWECRTSSATCCAPPPTYAHFIDFGGGAQQVTLKGLSWSQLSVLPPLIVTVQAVEITGTDTVEVEDVSLGWSVSQLNATIAERRGVSAELQRLVMGDVALDDADALLSLCGVGEGTMVHVVPQAAGAAAERADAAAAAAAATAGIAEGQPPPHPQRQQQQQRGGWCCASPSEQLP